MPSPRRANSPAPGSTPLEKSSTEPTKNHKTDERWPQITIEEVTSLTWVHEQDVHHYHDPYCEYKMRGPFRSSEEEMKSFCGKCGRTVESTLSGYKVTNGS